MRNDNFNRGAKLRVIELKRNIKAEENKLIELKNKDTLFKRYQEKRANLELEIENNKANISILEEANKLRKEDVDNKYKSYFKNNSGIARLEVQNERNECIDSQEAKAKLENNKLEIKILKGNKSNYEKEISDVSQKISLSNTKKINLELQSEINENKIRDLDVTYQQFKITDKDEDILVKNGKKATEIESIIAQFNKEVSELEKKIEQYNKEQNENKEKRGVEEVITTSEKKELKKEKTVSDALVPSSSSPSFPSPRSVGLANENKQQSATSLTSQQKRESFKRRSPANIAKKSPTAEGIVPVMEAILSQTNRNNEGKGRGMGNS
jgi:hypothetical protein